MRNEKGFTLIELLVVVAIIGILAAIAIPQFAAYRVRAYNSSSMSDLRNSITAQEAAFVDNGEYTTCAACASADLPGFAPTTDVTTNHTAKNVNATNDGFDADAVHAAGDKTHAYDSTTGVIS